MSDTESSSSERIFKKPRFSPSKIKLEEVQIITNTRMNELLMNSKELNVLNDEILKGHKDSNKDARCLDRTKKSVFFNSRSSFN